ncbi:MAG: methyltransferase domain-containing protein [Clostridiaceae bacterium]|nr:methyltransferase domain-containing protein [Clostridiaceae bacterium]
MGKEFTISNCSICGSPTEEIYLMHFVNLIGLNHDYVQKIHICNNCGFIFVANPFNKKKLEDIYTSLSKFEAVRSADGFIERKDYIRRAKTQYKFVYDNISEVRSVLDIGASTGFGLSLFKESGCKVFGVDPSVNNKETAKKVYGIDLYTGMFDAYITEYPNTQYDLVFLSHVLEHVIDPMDFMKKVSSISSRYIFIEVPVLDCKYADEPFGHFCDEHINHFTTESLSNLMKRLEYTPIQFFMNYYLYDKCPSGKPAIMTLWEKRKNIQWSFKPVINSRQYFDAYINDSALRYKEVAAAVDRINDNLKLAVWGVGNHTAKLFGMTNLGKKNIVKYYDNDPQKQMSKIRGIPIDKFNIKDIQEGYVEKILISTYTALKSILQELEQYGINDRIIKLYE